MLDAQYCREYQYPLEVRLAFNQEADAARGKKEIKNAGLALFTTKANTMQALLLFIKRKENVKMIEQEIKMMHRALEAAWIEAAK
jgi:hypothetical protein